MIIYGCFIIRSILSHGRIEEKVLAFAYSQRITDNKHSVQSVQTSVSNKKTDLRSSLTLFTIDHTSGIIE